MPLVLDRMPSDHLRVYKREGDGAWLAEGDTNREGIYLYEEDGRTIRELRTADTVRRMTPKIARSVLTMGHPEVEITPDNVQTLAHGDVDGGFDIVDQGGFVRGRQRVALRTADAIRWAEHAAARLAQGQNAVAGFSPGYIPIRDNTPGVDPKWGAYDRVLIDVAAVNHLALCGDSYDLPPARGGNDICALYLDAMPRTAAKDNTMKRPSTRAEWRALLSQDASMAILRRIFPSRTKGAKDAERDALKLEQLAQEVQAAIADPESLSALLVHAIVNKPAEVAEIMTGEEEMPDAAKPMDMPADMYGEMDARIAKALAPIKATLDALTKDKAARDAVSTATQDADLRRLGAFHGVKDAATLAIPALVTALADRLNLAVDSIGDPRPFVQGTAARRANMTGATLPIVAYDATQDADLKPATIEVM